MKLIPVEVSNNIVGDFYVLITGIIPVWKIY